MERVHFRSGVAGALPEAWIIYPEVARDAPPVLAIHGLNREAEPMAHLLAPQADVTGRTIILPVFDRTSWPRFQRAAGKDRADWALLSLLEVLRGEGWIGETTPDMSGFSGGAQFAHRFAWLYPEVVGRLCLVAPGWWTFPDMRGVYPCAMGAESPKDTAAAFRLRANLARFLDRDITVMVGALDVYQDRNLRQDAAVMDQQGPNRVVRARMWTAAALRAARRLGVTPNIRFHLMPECGHSFGDCVANGALAPSFVPFSQTPSQVPSSQTHFQLEEVA